MLTILFMEFLDFPRVLTIIVNVVVEFIPECNSGKFGSRKLCERVKGDSVKIYGGPIDRVDK